ncbi:DUF4214 domain-containing protein [Bdellovibrio sp. HCB2-146]|uniref:DUF4214 domain-containing protein n=1 Tax=Bdellovibrio sp. HCB2-146 TaxID=3394362 RepID=UPI0039BC9F3C
MNKPSLASNSLRSLALATVTALVALATLTAEAQVSGSIGRGGFDHDERGRGGYEEDRGEGRDGRFGRLPGRGREPGRGHEPGRGRDRDDDRYGRRGDFRDYRESQRLVDLIYEAALFRRADYEGLEAFSRVIRENGEIGLYNTARMIGSSEEFQRIVRYDGARRVVTNIYQVFFNRTPEPEGLRTWTRLIERGQGGDALDGIVRSDEFYFKQLR